MKKIFMHYILAIVLFVILNLVFNINKVELEGKDLGYAIGYVLGFGIGSSLKYIGFIIICTIVPIMGFYLINKSLWSGSLGLIWGVSIIFAVIKHFCIF